MNRLARGVCARRMLRSELRYWYYADVKRPTHSSTNDIFPTFLFSCVFLVLFVGSASADPDFFPHRRRSQYPHEPAWVAAPYIYDLPGIGRGFGFLGAVANVGGTYTDLLAASFMGEVNGGAVGINSVHIVPRHLILDMGGVRLSRLTFKSFAKRGMDTGKDDYTLAEFGTSSFGGSRLTATFNDRRYEFFVGYYGGSIKLDSLRDRDGNVILNAEDAPRAHPGSVVLGTRFDITDDYLDPRRGLLIEPSAWRATPTSHGPDYYFLDTSITGYIPAGKRNTWAFNFLRSDAHMLRQGETDRAVLAGDEGLDCGSLSDPSERNQCEEYLDAIIMENKFGTASNLGGASRLRSYAEGRYKGAHTEFFGAEFRWNLTDEVRPFNIYVMKDIRTTVQVAFFYEIGTVAENRGELWHMTRSSYGTGLRVVTASGVVYRIDIAAGQEGVTPNIFFQYPWQY